VLATGCVVVGTVKDGRAALAAAADLTPDVIVLDISMPGMTGLEVADVSARLVRRPPWCFSPSTGKKSSFWPRGRLVESAMS
jgi:CheY-like chemotaxis protein